ncbi:TPA: hypothetical protein N0F65_011098 [Lagenidium giganteum]|uniref:Uncharacterized protein n=1 Tax=Lagenidium giganteum TaxID=4803 RepID=A0AAV2ZLS4_9STRA|nr:TPA: hypothetical protein N0F65_011098 [Lagenidium giganteum]
MLFRATAGLTLDQQRTVATQLHHQGNDILMVWRHGGTARCNGVLTVWCVLLQYDWLHEHCHLKKLEETYSKELEALLLRMYNDASTKRVSDTLDDNHTLQGKCLSTSVVSASASPEYAAELHELLELAQNHRVGLLQQISSERDQRLAMKQLLQSVCQEHRKGVVASNNQREIHVRTMASMQELLYDAVIGHQMVEATLDDEIDACEKDYQTLYQHVMAALRGGSKSDDKSTDVDQKVVVLLSVVGALDCPDEMLRFEIETEFRGLFDEHKTDVARLEAEFHALAAADDAAGTLEAARSKTGGWPVADEDRFLKVLKGFERRKGSLVKPELLYDQCLAVLPHVTSKAIKCHVNFHQRLRFFQEKCRDRNKELERKLQELEGSATERVRNAIQQDAERKQRQSELEALQAANAERHVRVAEWKDAKQAQKRIAQQQREIDDMEKAQRLAEDEIRRKRKHFEQKALVEEYKRDKLLDKLAQEEHERDLHVAAEVELAARSIVNAERVEFRQAEYDRKVDMEREAQRLQAKREEQRLARLDALKQETPYAETIAQIQADPERTRKETVAFKANVEAAQEALPVHEAGLFPSHGYDTDTLFKNARFRLGLALRDAGLHTTDYARQALATVKVSNMGAYRHQVGPTTQLW